MKKTTILVQFEDHFDGRLSEIVLAAIHDGAKCHNNFDDPHQTMFVTCKSELDAKTLDAKIKALSAPVEPKD